MIDAPEPVLSVDHDPERRFEEGLSLFARIWPRCSVDPLEQLRARGPAFRMDRVEDPAVLGHCEISDGLWTRDDYIECALVEERVPAEIRVRFSSAIAAK